MRILTLQLENFQGIKSVKFDFAAQNASIYGDNATGKTTVFNAITWLLFNRASTGAKNFTPKTKGKDGDLHYLDHAVEAKLEMEDGRILTLRKVFSETYKKKRGSATDEFSGHSTDHFIDGVPVKEQEYTVTLLALCGGAEKMKMLTMPHYFAEDMSWEMRRQILLELCGDVTDQEVIATQADLGDLPAVLLMPGTQGQSYTVDEYKRIAGAKKSDINKRIQEIPGRIDEAERAIPDVSGVDADDIASQLEYAQGEIDRLSGEKTAILSGDSVGTEIRKQLSELETRLEESRATHLEKCNQKNEGVYSAIAEAQAEHRAAKNGWQDKQFELAQKAQDLEHLKSRRSDLLADYEAIQSEAWDESVEVCPTCHRALAGEDIQHLRGAFNLKKSQRLEEINARGKEEASKEMLEAGASAIQDLERESIALETTAMERNAHLEDLKTQIKREPFESTEEYASLTTEIATLHDRLSDAQEVTRTATESVGAKIQALRDEAHRLRDEQANIAIAEVQGKRIEELKQEEKALAGQYEELEHGIFLCDLFTKAKVAMLTGRINAKFKNVRFRLFVEQQNGGIKDDCEVMIPADGERMVPYTFANNAAKINAGLEIIGALSEHWRLAMPVFIDNAESVTRLIRVRTQVIRLIVSEGDKKLRMERE